MVKEQSTKTDYEVVIGLETHVQLTTATKMFCGCSADYHHAQPNSHICPTCLGLPGALPVVNECAVEYALMIGLALNCNINTTTAFDRKNYNYPDLMKGYQISQNDLPICVNGSIELALDPPQTIRINRVHMEEDVAKMTHADDNAYTLIDANRSGIPLIEIVTEPDFRSPEAVEEYIKALQQIIRYLNVGTAKMEAGSFRCDANVSIRPVGSDEFGTKVEIKNMNRINAVAHALKYEIKRQTEILGKGKRVVQETRGWDDEIKRTVSQRIKEDVNDYRYFPEPDIPPVTIGSKWLGKIKEKMPDLPAVRCERLMQKHDLSKYDAQLITADFATAQFFDEAIKSQPTTTGGKHGFGKDIANWLNGEMVNLRRKHKKETIDELGISPKSFARVVAQFRLGVLNNQSTKLVLERLMKSDKTPDQIIEEEGLQQVRDTDMLEQAVEGALKQNPKALKDYQSGNVNAIKFIVGQVMAATKGQADPNLVAEIIKNKADVKA